VKRGFQEVLKAIGITEELRKERNLVYHSAGRHTFITLLQKKGIPPFMVAGLSGHRSLAMVDNYTHFEKGHMDFGTARAAIEQAGKYEVTKDYITSV
jgi:site-specific recombinase XerD